MLPSSSNRRKRWYDVFSSVPHWIKYALIPLGILLVLFFAVVIVFSWRASQYDLAHVLDAPMNSAIYDAEGRCISALDDNERVNIALADAPQYLVDAFIAREDERFMEHGGIVYTSVLRSILKNISSFSYEQGASTITMQLARNVFDLRAKTIDRKLLEIAITKRIEEAYDKKTILAAYLNRIYFGQDCYGIAQAARTYFGKNVGSLNLSECATLAGLVRGPSYFNPIRNLKAATRERDATLKRMYETGKISEALYEKTKKEPIVVHRLDKGSYCSYIVMWVIDELESLCGEVGTESSGIRVHTSLNLPLQQFMERKCEETLQSLEKNKIWEGLPRRSKGHLDRCVQVAAMCVETRTGNVLAVIGGRSPQDGQTRWLKEVKPGMAFAPVVNCRASEKQINIIADAPLQTGRALGHKSVLDACARLHLPGNLPESDELYLGEFPLPLIDLARSLYCIQNRGKYFPLQLIQQVSSFGDTPLYVNTQQLDAKEVVPREAARNVASCRPFRTDETNRTMNMNITLPGQDGQWVSMAGRSVTVFLWLGFDEATPEMYDRKGFKKLFSETAANLAEQIYTEAKNTLNTKKK